MKVGRRIRSICILFSFLILMFLCCERSTTTGPDIKYWNEEIPRSTPLVFSPDFISKKGSIEGSAVFSPDGTQFFYSERNFFNNVSIMQMVVEGNVWSRPRKASFSHVKDNWEPFPSPDGSYIVFTSNRHDFDAKWLGKPWISMKADDGTWQQPERIELPVKWGKGIWHPTVSLENNMYFGADLQHYGNYGLSDIYVANIIQDSITIENIGEPINTKNEETHPFIAPDESYILFSSNRSDGIEQLDIYVSFWTDEGWADPLGLGSKINTEANEISAKVTPDNQFILFDRYFGEQGSEQDIYWVSAEVIERLRRKID